MAYSLIVVQPDQVARLCRLADTANVVFKRKQMISIVDLLYAAFWRHVGKDCLCSSLVVVEELPAKECGAAVSSEIPCSNSAGLDDSSRFTRFSLSGTGDFLKSQSLVSIAYDICRGICDARNDFPYEGWLIDSLADSRDSHNAPRGTPELMLSTLPLPHLQELLKSGTQMRPLSRSGQGNDVAEDLPSRLGCINFRKKDRVIECLADTYSADAQRLKVFHYPAAISIDIWLPLVEAHSLRSLFTDYYFCDDGNYSRGFIEPGSRRREAGSVGVRESDIDQAGIAVYGLIKDEFFEN